MKKIIIKSCYIFFLLILDLSLLYVASKIAFYLRFTIYESVFNFDNIWKSVLWIKYYQYINIFLIIFFIIAYHFQYYRLKIINKQKNIILDSIKVTTFFIIIIFITAFYFKNIIISRFFYIIFFIILVFFNILRNYIKQILLFLLYKTNLILHNVICVGLNSLTNKHIVFLQKYKYYNFIGYYSEKKKDDINLKYLGDLKTYNETITNKKNTVDEIIIDLSPQNRSEILNLTQFTLDNKIEVSVLQDLSDLFSGYIYIEELESIPLLKI